MFLKIMFLKTTCDGIVTVGKNENKAGKVCIVAVFETTWKCRNLLKTRTVNGAFSRYLKRFM